MTADAKTLERRQAAYDRVEEITELPMLVLSLAILPLLFVPLVTDLSDSAERAFFLADWGIWAVFAIELVIKTYLSPVRSVYLRQHWFDVLIVVLPFLRPLRVVRSARALRLLRSMRVFAFFARAMHSATSVFETRNLKYVLLVAVLVIFSAAGLVTLFERDGDGSIQDFGDALWWAIATITTVGYGDKIPETAEGRGVAVFLMLLGITLFSVVTANVASFLVRRDEGATLDDILVQLKKIEGELADLKQSNAERKDA